MSQRVTFPADRVHSSPLARGTKRSLNEVHSVIPRQAAGAIAQWSLSSPPPPAFGSPRQTSVRAVHSLSSPPPGAVVRHRAPNTVTARPAAQAVTRSPVAELFHPRQPVTLSVAQASGSKSGSNALVPRPRKMAPLRGQGCRMRLSTVAPSRA